MAEKEVIQIFQKFGKVDCVTIKINFYSGRKSNIEFVEMPDDKEAIETIKNMNEAEFYGNLLKVCESKK